MRFLRSSPSRVLARGLTRCGRRAFMGVSRLGRGEAGTSTVEFALVAIPFFGMIGAIADTSLTFWASQTLDDALNDAARTIQTGRFQSANLAVKDNPALALEEFRKQLCRINGQPRPTLFDCANVKLQVRTFTTIGGASSDNPVDPQTRDWATAFGSRYDDAKKSSIVVVQAATKFPIYLNLFGLTPTFKDGTRLLQSTVVLRTEPF